jgi:biotin synthase-like enzyme
VRAREQINQLSPGATPEQQAANQQRISQILQESGMTPDQYNAILSAAQIDQALNNRISVAAVGDSFTDAQLRSFIAASIEIQPINATLASGTDAERAAAAEQIRGILQRNNLNIETYNGIAAQIRSNPELQTRLNTLAQTAPSGME